MNNNLTAQPLTEAALEDALRQIHEFATQPLCLKPTRVVMPGPIIAWLDENAPPGWRERIQSMAFGDDVIAALWKRKAP